MATVAADRVAAGGADRALRGVSEPAQRARLGVIAVAGRSAAHERIAVVSDMPEAEVIEALREAVAGQLLVVEATTSGDERYAFRHALVQEVAYDVLSRRAPAAPSRPRAGARGAPAARRSRGGRVLG